MTQAAWTFGNAISQTEVDCCETCLQSGEGAQKQTNYSPAFSSPFSQFWLGPLNVLLLKDQTHFCFEVCLALKKHQCVRGIISNKYFINPLHKKILFSTILGATSHDAMDLQ